MTLAILPPKTEPMVDDDKFSTLNWIIFFEGLANGDLGTAWTPTFVGLTETGTATKTGVYYRINKKLAYFRIVITPSTDTSSTLGTTYCDNFPLTITSDSFCSTTSGFIADVSGVTASTKRIWTPNWTAITNYVTITGILEVS